MANDVIYYKALATELSTKLKGAKIDKIYQPESDGLVFLLRGMEHLKNETLYLSAKPDFAQAILSPKKRENPMTAPAFCMLMRKKLMGGVIRSVDLYNFDRMIRFEIINRNELKDETIYYLIIELMGRYNNLVLTDQNLKVVDALRRIPLGSGGNRYLMPGLPFECQPHGKIRLDDAVGLANVDWTGNDKSLISQISGISKETARELLFLPQSPIDSDENINQSSAAQNTVLQAKVTQTVKKEETVLPSKLADLDFFALEPKDRLYHFLNLADQCNLTPTVVLIDAKPTALLPFDYQSIAGSKKYFKTLSEATEFFYESKLGFVGENDKTKSLKKQADKLLIKLTKKRAECVEKIENDTEIEHNRQLGELIYNNIYKAKPLISILVCDDFYSNTVVEVPLDPTISASANAEAYFKKYRKLKRAKEVAETQIVTLDTQITYLESIVGSLSTATTEKELREVFDELKLLSGKGRAPISKQKKQTPSAPLKCTVDGFTLYIGRNNLQNEQVTFQIADKHDLWFHAKAYHGSHVIVKTEKREVPLSVLTTAAALAAFYSGGKSAGKVEVDYTEKRNVKRNGAALGMVYYVEYRTLSVEPQNNTN